MVTDEFILNAAIDSLEIDSFEDACLFVYKWVFRCNNRDEYKYLKLLLERIQDRVLCKKYSFEMDKIANKTEETELRKAFNKDCDLFFTLSLLIDDEMFLNTMMPCPDENNYSEKQMQKDIIDNFSELFPQYIFVKKEFKTKYHGTIDILAKDNDSNRDVIIELKLNNRDPRRQLHDYACEFDDPVLISITQEEINKNKRSDDIIYYTFDNESMSIKLL